MGVLVKLLAMQPVSCLQEGGDWISIVAVFVCEYRCISMRIGVGTTQLDALNGAILS